MHTFFLSIETVQSDCIPEIFPPYRGIGLRLLSMHACFKMLILNGMACFKMMLQNGML